MIDWFLAMPPSPRHLKTSHGTMIPMTPSAKSNVSNGPDVSRDNHYGQPKNNASNAPAEARKLAKDTTYAVHTMTFLFRNRGLTGSSTQSLPTQAGACLEQARLLRGSACGSTAHPHVSVGRTIPSLQSHPPTH